MDHPIEISPLTKKKPDNLEWRVSNSTPFSFATAFASSVVLIASKSTPAYFFTASLNDPIDQRERFKAQEELLAQGDEEANTTDEDFLNALEIGITPLYTIFVVPRTS